MRVTDVRVQVLRPENSRLTWSQKAPPRQKHVTIVYVDTDDGVVGVGMTAMPGAPEEVASTVKHMLRDQVVGQDPFFREQIWQNLMMWSNRGIAGKGASIIDIALWDIAGKVAGLPIYKLLGAYRDEIPAYASTVSYATEAEYDDVVLDCKKQGFRAIKLHPFGDPDRDIQLCARVRELVGPDMILMLDPVNDYNFYDAGRVGRALQDFGFFWYEAPIRDDDMDGLATLARDLDIPIAVGESFTRGPWEYPKYLTAGAGDYFRCVGDSIGGITAMRKIGALCEAFNRNLEPHSYGNTLTQAAHLHYMLSVSNCAFFECPVPAGIYDIGMKDVIRVNERGKVVAPVKAGLGYDLDQDAIDAATVFKA